MPKVLQLAFVLIALAFCSPVFSHAKLRSSTPENNSRLTQSPKTLTLVFNEDVQLAVLKLNTKTKEIPISIDSKLKAAPEVTVAIPLLAPGDYQVNWSALSPRDGHIMKGHLSFSVVAPR